MKKRNSKVIIVLASIFISWPYSISAPIESSLPEDEKTARESDVQQPPGKHYDYRFRWNHWGFQKGDTEVFVNGISIGKGLHATAQLAKMTFKLRHILQIDLPAMPDGALSGINKDGIVVRPFFESEDFLQKWIYQGVRIEFCIEGKPAEIHTLAALDEKRNPTDPLYLGNSPRRGVPKGIFLFDGTECKTLEEALVNMGKAKLVAGSMILVCGPIKEHGAFASDEPWNGIGSVLYFLSERGSTKVMWMEGGW